MKQTCSDTEKQIALDCENREKGNVRSESYDNHPSFLPGGFFQITVLERWKEGEDK